MTKKDDQSYLKIVGMGYRGKLPGDKKRESKAKKYADDIMTALEVIEKRSGKAKKKEGN